MATLSPSSSPFNQSFMHSGFAHFYTYNRKSSQKIIPNQGKGKVFYKSIYAARPPVEGCWWINVALCPKIQNEKETKVSHQNYHRIWKKIIELLRHAHIFSHTTRLVFFSSFLANCGILAWGLLSPLCHLFREWKTITLVLNFVKASISRSVATKTWGFM